MNGLYTWASSSIYSTTAAAYNATAATYNAAYNVTSATYNAAYYATAATYNAACSATSYVYQSGYDFTYDTYKDICDFLLAASKAAYSAKEYASESFEQYYQGLINSLVLSIIKGPELLNPNIFDFSKTQEMLGWSILTNIGITAGSRYVYELLLKPSVQKIPYAGPVLADIGFPIAAAAFYQRRKISMAVNNLFQGMNISRAAYNENYVRTQEKKKKNRRARKEVEESKKACSHDQFAAIQAMFAVPFYRIANSLTAEAIISLSDYFFHTGKYVGFPLEALVAGQNLVGDKINCEWVCTDDYFKIQSQNNWFSFGLGTALLGSYNLLTYLLGNATGVKSDYINDAIYVVLYQLNSILTQMPERKLPGEKDGDDLSYIRAM